jgi:hypothetical protein
MNGLRRVLEIALRGLSLTIDSLADEVHPPRPKRKPPVAGDQKEAAWYERIRW